MMSKTREGWYDMAWNPVTGCRRACKDCAARSMAMTVSGRWDETAARTAGSDGGIHVLDRPLLRHTSGKNRDAGVRCVPAPFPYGFDPTFHRYRLGKPARNRGRTILVCGMGDLFGEWVPEEWIAEVLDACLAAPGNDYLFLTRNPGRCLELDDAGILPRQDGFRYVAVPENGDHGGRMIRDMASLLDRHAIFTRSDP